MSTEDGQEPPRDGTAAVAHPAGSTQAAVEADGATRGTTADVAADAASTDTADASSASTDEVAEPVEATTGAPAEATPAEADADHDTKAEAVDNAQADLDVDADRETAAETETEADTEAEADDEAAADHETDEASDDATITDDDPSASQDTPHPPLPALADSIPLPARVQAPAAAFGRLMSRRSPLVHLGVLAVAWVLALGGVALLWQGLPGGGGGAGIWGFLGLLMACVGCGLGVAQAVPVARTREPEIAASGWAVAGLATAVIGGLGVVAVVAINEIAWVWNRIG
ncbi:hypothetical protein ACPA54_17795 [Uniformispora flossi]|uniref:hypothetical protein n=1 Tax=Uniformispora flossi TaxID=3390723 RepID=UPI003C2AB7E2